jgi:hypothetical protein
MLNKGKPRLVQVKPLDPTEKAALPLTQRIMRDIFINNYRWALVLKMIWTLMLVLEGSHGLK